MRNIPQPLRQDPHSSPHRHPSLHPNFCRPVSRVDPAIICVGAYSSEATMCGRITTQIAHARRSVDQLKKNCLRASVLFSDGSPLSTITHGVALSHTGQTYLLSSFLSAHAFSQQSITQRDDSSSRCQTGPICSFHLTSFCCYSPSICSLIPFPTSIVLSSNPEHALNRPQVSIQQPISHHSSTQRPRSTPHSFPPSKARVSPSSCPNRPALLAITRFISHVRFPSSCKGCSCTCPLQWQHERRLHHPC
jgi:hypothetical protein